MADLPIVPGDLSTLDRGLLEALVIAQQKQAGCIDTGPPELVLARVTRETYGCDRSFGLGSQMPGI
jgi:hypothetical protein